MGEKEITDKLQKELEKEITEESQVVYILSRIRKKLETNKLKSRYRFLNFFCNWALHARIDRTEPVADILREFIDGKNFDFIRFKHLAVDLSQFIEQFNLSSKILEPTNFRNFTNILAEICADTPVEVYPQEKRIITIKRVGFGNEGEYQIMFSVTDSN